MDVSLNLPVALVIMDGFGLDKPSSANAISQANKPFIDSLFNSFTHTTLSASGSSVGLPDGQMGNSEVGHLNIGAGRIVEQELPRINNACKNASINDIAVLKEACVGAKENAGVLHLMGLLSDGGVHSHINHLFSLVKMAINQGVSDVYIHCFMDGRDVPPTSGIGYLNLLQKFIDEINSKNAMNVVIASISGRYYAMDRDNRWDRVQKAFDTIVSPESLNKIAPMTPSEYLEKSYQEGITDEYVVPTAFNKRGVADGDAVVFFNFRPDRARQISHAFVDGDFDKFPRIKAPKVFYVCLTEYDSNLDAPVAFPKQFPTNVFADVLSDSGLRQYHIAETEKYAHVTFFFNGGKEEAKFGEKRCLIPSPKVATYDMQPEMSAPEVSTALSDAITNDIADVYIVNFANCDMVGHTGVMQAAIKAVEAVDSSLNSVLNALKDKAGIALITADHGNADKMLNEDGSIHTAHTTALVPLILADYSGNNFKLNGKPGSLCDIVPTLLDIIGLDIPNEMTGISLLQK